MTLRIERLSDGERAILRLIGRVRAQHLEALTAEIKRNQRGVLLDMEEVTLVDVEVIQFLVACEAGAVKLIHCSPYIREWMNREREEEG